MKPIFALFLAVLSLWAFAALAADVDVSMSSSQAPGIYAWFLSQGALGVMCLALMAAVRRLYNDLQRERAEGIARELESTKARAESTIVMQAVKAQLERAR